MAQPMLVLAACLSIRGVEDQNILDHACFFMREGMAAINCLACPRLLRKAIVQAFNCATARRERVFECGLENSSSFDNDLFSPKIIDFHHIRGRCISKHWVK
jgi:hypothetical protein